MEKQLLVRRQSSSTNTVLVIHGGAGSVTRTTVPPPAQAQYRERLAAALLAGNEVLQSGGEAIDAVVAAVEVMEDSPLFNAGKGAVFNNAGKNELEASIMLSKPPSTHKTIPATRRGVSATLLTRIKNPSHLVRALYLSPDLDPHPFLSGVEVERIAAEDLSIDLVDPSYFYTDRRWREHRRGLGLPEETFPVSTSLDKLIDANALPQGTVGAVALDANGCIAVLTSTGGKTNKLVGRIGDTPLMGAGFWAEEWTPISFWSRMFRKFSRKCPLAIGISGTGDGDYFIRQNTASTIVHLMKFKGYTLHKAAKSAIRDLSGTSGTGGVICLDSKGNVSMPMNSTGMFRGVIKGEGIPLIAIFSDELPS